MHDAEPPHSRVNNESIEESDKDNGIRNRGRAAHAGYNDGYESKLPDLNQTKYDEDPFSSDESEWSSQFGEVVPGHFFR